MAMRIGIDAGTVEAWTTGDADVLESKTIEALRVVAERVAQSGKEETVAVVILAPGDKAADE
jgi:hypothetical protein